MHLIGLRVKESVAVQGNKNEGENKNGREK